MNKYTKLFPKGGTWQTLEVQHNMGTEDVIVQVFQPDGESIDVGIIRETNVVKLLFNGVPDFDVKVIVIG